MLLPIKTKRFEKDEAKAHQQKKDFQILKKVLIQLMNLSANYRSDIRNLFGSSDPQKRGVFRGPL